ncbi:PLASMODESMATA CALLOSE-BINDING PROTEIN 3 [Heracleum sosnowskyi]|uniref:PLASMODESMATA CALLOSE-BINDING PROTEIN 3 n=1 Tax=Heracleum sosnowskyi TaxID=360622 RepID=A0AAD8IFK5_9APIA|nr:PLASMODESMATA CALLOSE-BINDING PROTEIN 3 [Heracleum sosnowskyi]
MAQKLANLMALVLAMSVGHSSATWCVCKPGLSETVLQKSIDYACGNGADCTLIHQGGGCYNPNTVPGHCNYAVNSYFQRKGQASGSCDFGGAAVISTSDPSVAGCVYPSSASAATTTNTPKSSMTPVGGSPYMTTPSNGVLGGVNSLGPSGVGTNTDDSAAGGLKLKQSTSKFFTAIMFLGNLFLWG